MSDEQVTRVRRWKVSRQGIVPILLLVFFGLMFTWALVQEVSRLERERVRTAFAAAARDRILVIQRELQSSLNVVQDIGSFFDVNRQVRRGQYREFVRPVLKRDSSIRSLEWVPQVMPAEREEFLRTARLRFPNFDIFAYEAEGNLALPDAASFPLLYAHPYRRGMTPLGLDLATVPAEYPAIREALKTKRMQVVQSGVAFLQTSAAAELSVYLPVFERLSGDDDHPYDFDGMDVVNDSFGALRGIAVGRFVIAEIVNRALSNLSPSGIDIEIRSADEDSQVETPGESVYKHLSRLRPGVPGTLEKEHVVVLELAETIEVGGIEWRLVCTAVPGIYEPGVWSARLVATGGVAFTLLLAAYLVNLIRRAEDVEKLVSRRTLELKHSNEALNRQIVERMKAEEALQSLNTTLEQRVALRAAEAERRAGELEQFAYVTSHDLKAPLRAIANLSEWLEEDLKGKLTIETREQLSLMRDRVGRMHALIEGLLSYSRVGRTDDELAQVDCGELVAEVVDSIAPPSGFTVEVATGLPILCTDRLQLGQVFANLIGNSIKHHDRDRGHVRVSGRDLDRLCEFVVADDGPGIPAQYHDKVFMMFQTLHVKDFGSNTGIGLAMVKKIVEEHGGTIEITSGDGVGTEIRFTWAPNKIGNTTERSEDRKDRSA